MTQISNSQVTSAFQIPGEAEKRPQLQETEKKIICTKPVHKQGGGGPQGLTSREL